MLSRNTSQKLKRYLEAATCTACDVSASCTERMNYHIYAGHSRQNAFSIIDKSYSRELRGSMIFHLEKYPGFSNIKKAKCRYYSASSDKSIEHETDSGSESRPENSRLLEDDSVASLTSNYTVPRSKKLASIIRDGVVLLNQTAATIKSNSQTTKSLFTSPEEKSEPNPKQLAEEHRIFETAQKCLEDLCTRDPSFPLMAGDEPILLLGVRVNPSFTHADLYWSLPFGVLSTKELNEKQREYLKGKMSERVDGAPGRILLQRINSVLSNYYPPKIRFKEAPPLLVYQVLYDLGEE